MKKHSMYITEGTSALKHYPERSQNEGTLYRSAERRAYIIDFEAARAMSCVTRTDEPKHCQQRGLISGIVKSIRRKIIRNKILKGLFQESRQANSYKKEDVAIFAKGFSATAALVFALILIGI